jgi:hypothetical protein
MTIEAQILVHFVVLVTALAVVAVALSINNNNE